MNKHLKRNIAALLPYYKKDGTLYFFLQLRDENAPSNPNVYGFFGGGIEDGETPETGMYREIEEELEYKPVRPRHIFSYKESGRDWHQFIEEVTENFADRVIVHEGKGGLFLSVEDILSSDLSPEKLKERIRMVIKKL